MSRRSGLASQDLQAVGEAGKGKSANTELSKSGMLGQGKPSLKLEMKGIIQTKP